MRRKLLIVLAAIAAFGPALGVLYIVSTWWRRPPEKYPDLHAPWVIVSIMGGYIGLATALDLVLQVLRTGRRPSHSAWLCGGTVAACVAGLLSLWMMWLTPWRPWLLIVNGLALVGLFCLLYRCGCRWELRLFGLAFVVAGLVLFVVALREVYTIAAMAQWERTEGRVTDSGASGSRAGKFMTTHFAFEYVVNGQRYTGHEDSWKSTRMCHGWGPNLDRVGSPFSWNEKVGVYHDLSEPRKAVLRPGLSYATAFILRVSLLSILGGLALVVASAQLRQTQGAPSRTDRTVSVLIQSFGLASLGERGSGRVAFGLLTTCALLVVTCIRPLGPEAMAMPRIDRVPATVNDFCQRGLDFLRRHEPERAFNNFTRALRLNPNDAALYYDRGHACVQMGRMAQALEEWKKAIQVDWHLAFPIYYARRQLPSADAELDQIIAKVAVDHVDDLEEVSGYAVGGMGSEGEFYTASLILSAHLKDEDFLRMSDSQNAIVRAMALICLARRDVARYQTTIRSFYDDAAEVRYVPSGCVVRPISLGALARIILDNPTTLQYWDPDKTRRRWQRKTSE